MSERRLIAGDGCWHLVASGREAVNKALITAGNIKQQY